MHPPAFIIHGHFYQPPRENPWTGILDREPSAAPDHNWNERIFRECYRANGYARIFDEAGSVVDIVNNYEHLSFNFGPTLLSWLEREHPDGYARIIEADRNGHRLRGHGGAIAQGYNHTILPLCNERDMRTQIRWGLREFQHRFGRQASSLWMPETACDDRTLGALIDEGMQFALLAPGQAQRVREGDGWRDVSDGSIDPGKPYKYLHRDGSGRSIALFFYDGSISRAVAFEGALSSSQALVDRFERSSGGEGTLVHAVTDGESYGHHFKFGDRCLAHALTREAKRRGFWVTNYSEFLERHPPEQEVEIKAGDDGRGTSWSCAHGVGRWYRDCGCQTGGRPEWSQAWRGPLRAAFDLVRDEAAKLYEERMGELVKDPWAVRDEYIELLVGRRTAPAELFERHAGRRLGDKKMVEALRLCEMQRSSMLMYTSCGWFFNDISGIETLQDLCYAGRLFDQLEELGAPASDASFLQQLSEAPSNIASKGHGADIYRAAVTPARVLGPSLAAHVSISSLPRRVATEGEVAGRRYKFVERKIARRGRWLLATAQLEMVELATGSHTTYASCALHFGGVELHCVLAPLSEIADPRQAEQRIHDAFETEPLLTLLRVVEAQLGHDDYGVDCVLPSEREAVSHAIFAELRGRYAAQYEAMYQDAQRTIAEFHGAGLPLVPELRSAAELALSYRLQEEIRKAPTDPFAPEAYLEAAAISREAQSYECSLDRRSAVAHFEMQLSRALQRVCAGDAVLGQLGPVQIALSVLETAKALGIELNLERAQERLFFAFASGAVDRKVAGSLEQALSLSASR